MKCLTPDGRPGRATLVLLVGVPALLAVTFPMLKFELGRSGTMFGALGNFLNRLIVAPDPKFLPKLVGLIGESFLIAFAATVIAVLVSVPGALLAARNTSPHPVVGGAVRAIASLLRATPDLILALLLASAVGLGNVPGVLALFVAGIGFLVKAYAESLEVVSRHPVEGLQASGADAFSVRWLGVVPQALPDIVSLSLYQLDVNLRSAAILGAVGAGGIGYELTQSIRLFHFDRLGAIIVAIYLSVTLVDVLSGLVRRRLV